MKTAREMRRRQTPVEDLFWELVRNRRFLGLKFRRQHQLGDYVADFYCHEHRLVIEFDGGVHKARQKKDHKRDAWMEAQGLTVLRFSNDRLLNDPEGVFSTIAEAALPSPSGRGDGGEGSVEELDHLFPARLVDSELGEIPEGWEVVSLPEAIDFLEGPGLRNWQYRDEGMKFLNIRCINNGDLDLS